MPRDWPKRMMLEGGMMVTGEEEEEGGAREGSFDGGVRPVRKDSMISASVVRPASVGEPVLRPKPR